MPVMPAPTTSTSTSVTWLGDGVIRRRGSRSGVAGAGLYRPVSISSRQGTPGVRGASRGDGGAEAAGTSRAPRDGAPRPGAQGALPRPRLLPARGRAAVVPGVADGLPAGGDPAAPRLRRVRDPRPVGRRRPHRGRRGDGIPERLSPPRRPGRRRPGHVRERVHLPVPRLVLRPRRHATRPCRGAARSPSTTCGPRTSTSVPCGARRGAAARGSTSTTTLRRCGPASSRWPPCLDAWKLESMQRRVVVRRPPARELEARRGGVHRAVPRHRDPPPAPDPRPLPTPGPGGVRPPHVPRRRAPLPAHDERGHGRDGPRQRRAHRRGPPRHRAARRAGRRRSRPGTARSTTPSSAGTASRATTSPTSTSSRTAG